MTDELRKKFRDRLNAPAEPHLEVTRDFLLTFCADMETMEEVKANITGIAEHFLRRCLAGLEGVLADPPPDDTLSKMVAWEVGWVLDDTSEEGARKWIGELAQLVRDSLAHGGAPG